MYVSTFNVIFYTPPLKKRMESPFGWKILVEYVAVDKKVEGALLRPWIQRFGSIKAIIILKWHELNLKSSFVIERYENVFIALPQTKFTSTFCWPMKGKTWLFTQ